MRRTSDHRHFLRRAFVVLAALSLPLRVLAQVPQERTVPLEETIEQEMEQSRFHLGPVRLLPRFSLSHAGYDNNIFGTAAPTVSDWTANVSLGLHMILPIGSKTYLRGDALPEYDWYAHHVEKRTLGGYYGGSLLGFFNRMALNVSADSLKRVRTFSSERETFVTAHTLNGSANAEVTLSRRVSFFAGGEGHRVRYSTDGLEPTPGRVQEHNRDDFAVDAGVRFRWSSFFNVAAQVEGTQTNFAVTSQRDNRTRAYLVALHYNRQRLFVNFNGGYRVGRPYGGSTFASFSTTTGSYFVSYFLTQTIELQGYGHRATGYSLISANAYYFETRNGGGVNLGIGRRFRLHGFGEYGTNDYPLPVSSGTGLVDRTDHFTSVGGGLSTLLFRNAWLTALVRQTKVSSNVPGVPRSIFRFTTDLTLQANRPQ